MMFDATKFFSAHVLSHKNISSLFIPFFSCTLRISFGVFCSEISFTQLMINVADPRVNEDAIILPKLKSGYDDERQGRQGFDAHRRCCNILLA